MFRIASLLFFSLTTTIAQQNDVSTASDYGRVREILREYYTNAARQYGHDYDPDAVIEDSSRQPCDSQTEQCVNKKIWGDLFENDIVLTLNQAERLLDESNRRGKRQAQPSTESFWKSLTIPYVFGVRDSTWQRRIREALKHIEQETCIRFAENGVGNDRLQYIRGSGCWSNVGRIGGTQQVSIGYGCENKGIIAHETLHALGLWHEQSRIDRDNYLFINPSYIIRGTEGNFQKRTRDTSDNMGQPYDLGSVMHYAAKSFTTNWNQPTITTRDPRYQRTIGQRDGISYKDAKMINLRYCDKVCSNKLSCYNNGYTDPNDCYKCRCPPGYGGRYCEQLQITRCGGELTASNNFQKLESGNVRSDTYCIWKIKSPAGQKLELNFDKINFICREVCSSYVEVKYMSDKTASGARLCCNDQRTNILSEGDEAILIFKGENDIPNGYQGFTLNYRYYGSSATTIAPWTTTTTTTTQRPTTTTRPYWWTTTDPNTSTGQWSLWSEWSRCSEPCGGCGRRKRIRACFGPDGSCVGYPNQVQPCNSQVCIGGKKGHVCSGRVLIPCELAHKLHFGASQTEQSPTIPSLRLPHPRDNPQSYGRYKRSVRLAADGSSLGTQITHTGPLHPQKQNTQLCEKRFSYYCPSNILTIHIDWLRAADSYPAHNDSPQCCTNYYASNGQCYKNE